MVEERRETARQNTLKDEKVSVDKEHVPTKLGLDFLAKFYRLLKGAGLYDRKNIHMDRLMEDCLEAIQAVMDLEGQLYLKVVRDNLFFNNYRLQVRADRYTVLRGLLQELRKRWIGEIEITEKITGEQLKEFVYLIASVEENNETNYLVVNRKLEFRDVRMIHTGKLESFRDEDIYVDSEDQK